MNKHVAASDFVGAEALKLVAVPAPGETATYFRLHALREAAHALDVSITRYLNTPALPACADYRQRRLNSVEEDVADLKKVLSDA